MIDSVFVDYEKMTAHEIHCLENAEYFKIVYAQFKPHNRQTEFANTFDDAVSFALDNPKERVWMIYAITELGRSAHITNVG